MTDFTRTSHPIAHMNLRTAACWMFLLVGLAPTGFAQTLAFPGAEGYGKFTSGGRGGAVYEVTTLDDSGPGSLRAGIDSVGPRTIVFRVSGTIVLASRLTIRNGSLTIAGQTAPGDGICLAGYPVVVNADNVILRFLRFRLGDVNQVEDDALNGRERSNIIIDHCSMTWSVDEASSFYDNSGFTMQWCLVGESLYQSLHDKGAHGYGGIWGGQGASFHHNLIVHNTSRNPRFNGSRYSGRPDLERVDFVNNVLYNWGFNSMYGGEGGSHNIRSNYLKPGPATATDSKQYRIFQPYSYGGVWGRFYIADNYIHGYPAATQDNWGLGVQGVSEDTKQLIRVDTMFSVVAVSTQTPEDAYLSVLDGVGAIYPKRDSVDSRIIHEVMTGTATYGGTYSAPASPSGIIDSQNDVGGWPVLQTAPPPADADRDGMPDDWELAQSLDPNNPADRNGDLDADGYTNLEEYLNGLSTFPNFLPGPIDLTGTLVSTNAVRLTWRDQSESETAFLVERSALDSFVVIATLNANETLYVDSLLQDTTTYQYRVMARNDSLTSAYSSVVEVTTHSASAAPLAASSPIPADGAVYVETAPLLSWRAGLGATTHEVYLGISPGPLALVAGVSDTSLPVDSLVEGTEYVWRVDGVNEFGTTTGVEWFFTTRVASPQAILAHWSFDEGGGRSAIDSGAHSIVGTLTSMDPAAWVTGIRGSALAFDGVDDHVFVPHHASLSMASRSFSISFWIRVGTSLFDGSSRYALHKGSFVENLSAGRSGKWYGFEIKGSELRFSVDDNTVKTSASVTNLTSLLSHEWNHVVGVRDSVAVHLRVYVNGILHHTVGDGTGDISEAEPLYVGNSSDKTNTMSGSLDDLRFFSYPLSDAEIAALYGSTQTSVQLTSAMHLDFDLGQNFPNPFNPTTAFQFSIALSGRTIVRIFDVLGREVAILVNEDLPTGSYTATFDASDLPSGTYIYNMTSGSVRLSRKMMLVK